MTKFIVLTLILIASLFYGCGISSVPSGSYNTEMRQIEVTAVDGVIRNARVRLASLLNGSISSSEMTDHNGRAALTITLQRIEDLNNDDMLYLIVESVSGSTVILRDFAQTELPLQPGQVKLKSYLGRASILKSKAAIYEKLHQDPELGKRAVISHLSNSVSLMLDVELNREGLINGIALPETYSPALNPDRIRKLEEYRSDLLREQAAKDSVIGSKLHLLTIATKALIEQGTSNFLDDQRNFPLTQGAEALMELALNTVSGLNSDFLQKIEELDNLVENDVQIDTIVRAGLDDPNAVFDAIDFISVEELVAATAVSELSSLKVSAKSLTSTSTYRSAEVVIDSGGFISGGGFTGNSAAPAVRGNFVYIP